MTRLGCVAGMSCEECWQSKIIWRSKLQAGGFVEPDKQEKGAGQSDDPMQFWSAALCLPKVEIQGGGLDC